MTINELRAKLNATPDYTHLKIQFVSTADGRETREVAIWDDKAQLHFVSSTVDGAYNEWANWRNGTDKIDTFGDEVDVALKEESHV